VGGDPAAATAALARNRFDIEVVETAPFLLGERTSDAVFISAMRNDKSYTVRSKFAESPMATWETAVRAAVLLVDGGLK
jgi:hypothetical protein